MLVAMSNLMAVEGHVSELGSSPYLNAWFPVSEHKLLSMVYLPHPLEYAFVFDPGLASQS
jgi:hypothetical protein